MMRMEHFKCLLRCIFGVLRVSSFNGLYSAPRPFLLTLTTVNVDNIIMCIDKILANVNICGQSINVNMLCAWAMYVDIIICG